MKKLFIFLNIMLSFCVAWRIYTPVSYQPAPPDEELDLTPQGASIKQVGVFDQATIAMPGDLSVVYEDNIFLADRGQEEKVLPGNQPKPYKGAFELTGLFKIANIQGAVINSAGSRRSKALKSKFYRIGEKIGETGYTLEEISAKDSTAVISNGRSREVLKLDKNDSGSLKRRQSEVAKQESIKRQLNLSKPRRVTPKPIKSSVKPAPKSAPAKKTAADIAAIRKKILERMKAKKARKK
jgi:hypothetical protein